MGPPYYLKVDMWHFALSVRPPSRRGLIFRLTVFVVYQLRPSQLYLTLRGPVEKTEALLGNTFLVLSSHEFIPGLPPHLLYQ